MKIELKPPRAVALASLICALFLATTFGQDQKPLFSLSEGQSSLDDECGNPLVESQLYEQRTGYITKIVSSNRVLFRSVEVNGNKEDRTYTIILVGISPKRNRSELVRFLKSSVLNRQVEVEGDAMGRTDKKYGGVIRVLDEESDIDDLNEYLLEEGLAAYSAFKSNNLVPYYWPCRLERAQNKAMSAKVGIWNSGR